MKSGSDWSMTRLQALTRASDLLTCSRSNDLTHEKFDAFEMYFRRLQSKLHTVTEDRTTEVTAAAAPTPIQTGHSLTPAIARTTSSPNNIQSQLSQLLLSTEGGSVPPAVDHSVDALRIAPVALGGGLGSLSLNPTTNSFLQGLQRPLLPTTDRQASLAKFCCSVYDVSPRYRKH